MGHLERHDRREVVSFRWLGKVTLILRISDQMKLFDTNSLSFPVFFEIYTLFKIQSFSVLSDLGLKNERKYLLQIQQIATPRCRIFFHIRLFFTNVAIALWRTVLQKTELLLWSACANNLSIQQLFPCLDLLLRQPTVKSEFKHKLVDILSTCTTVETIIWNISFLKGKVINTYV